MAEVKEVIKKAVPEGNKNYKEPVSSYKLVSDSQQDQLGPIYYWILDFIQDMGWDVKKITDNFANSPGSANFSDMGMKATKMQDEALKILGGLNQVIKSALNLIYDLKEFEIRLKQYDKANSKDANEKEEGILALKQIWLDNVDLKKNRGSIHQMAGELGYTTIREAFMMANSVDDIKKIKKDGGIINDQVMRILIPRVSEFLIWKDYSEKELRKRMNIEKNYLKSQVETIKLYSAWIKPYLRAAEELRQKGFEGSAALVSALSTTMFELTLMCKKEQKVPAQFSSYKMKRKYYSVVVVNMKYRGHVSQRVTQKGDYGFAMGGRIDMIFDSYSLNEEELKVFEKEFTKDDVLDNMSFSMNIAEESLKELKEDLDHFLKNEDDRKKEEQKEKKKEESKNVNPFVALLGIFGVMKKDEKKKNKEIEKAEDIVPDNYIEKIVRSDAAKTASGTLYTIYDVYKKAHGMASAPGGGFEREDGSKTGYPSLKKKDIFKRFEDIK
jgi:hypothetical protein